MSSAQNMEPRVVEAWRRPPKREHHTNSGSSAEPSLYGILAMLGVMFAIHLVMVSRSTNFQDLSREWYDNPGYELLASAIRNWHSPDGDVPGFFWGFPYSIAAASALLHISVPAALVLVAAASSVLTVLLVHRMYGGWVTAAFIVLNYRWLQLSLEGGSETLFTSLLCASFLAARSNRWGLAALFAALTTTVRPVGSFALIAFVITLAHKREFSRIIRIATIGVTVGLFYFALVWKLTGRPFFNLISYRGDWNGGWPISYPFHALVVDFSGSLHGARWYSILFNLIWPVASVIALARIWIDRRRFEAQRAPEIMFAAVYIAFLISYNIGAISWQFSRFLVPALPMMIYAMEDWIPHDRRILWGSALISSFLSAAAIVHFRNL